MVFHSAERNYKTHRPKGDTTTLRSAGPVKLQNLKNLRPARAVNPHAAGVSIGDTTTLSPERAVQLKNPRARQGLSNFGPFGPVNPHAHQGVSKGDTTTLSSRRPMRPLERSEHNPSIQPAPSGAPPFYFAAPAATTTLGPKGRRPFLHNLPPQAAITSSPAGAGHLPF